MKIKLLLFLSLIGISVFPQIQNTKLSEGLLLNVMSGANSLPGVALTSGSLEVGGVYTIGNYLTNDDFTNVGAASNASGVTFTATGTTPTHWAHSSLLRKKNVTALTTPDPSFSMTNTGAIPTYGHKGNASYLAFDGVDDFVITQSLSTGTNSYSITSRIQIVALSAATIIYEGRDDGGDGIVFYVGSDGKISLIHNAITTKSSNVLSVGITYNIDVSVTYGGKAKIYINGIECSYDANPDINTSISTTHVGWIGRSIADQYGSFKLYQTRIFNYALDQTAVTYYSNPANHLKGIDHESPIALGYATSSFSLEGLVANAWYKISYDLTTSSGSSRCGGNIDWVESLKTSTGTYTTLFQYTSGIGNDNRIYCTIAGAASVSNFVCQRVGSLLDLTAESFISPTLIRDWYHSTDIALTGATAPRLVRQGNLSAWRFNGTSSYLSLADASAPQLTGDVTVSFWLNLSTIKSFNVILFNGKLDIYGASSGILVLTRNFGDDYQTPAVSVIDTWQHICLTSTSTGVTNIYVDGVLSGTANQSGGTPEEGSVDLKIGSDGTYFTHGIIDGLTITKGIWSAEQIALSFSSFQE